MANLIFESAGTIVTVITIMMNSHSLAALRVSDNSLLFVILFAIIGLALYRWGLLLHEHKNESEQKKETYQKKDAVEEAERRAHLDQILTSKRLKLVYKNPYRIGDWVTDIYGHFMRVIAIYDLSVVCWHLDDDDAIYEVTDHVERKIGGIPLTDEVLSMLGFRKGMYGDWYLVMHADGKLTDGVIEKILSLEIPHIGYNPAKHFLRIKNLSKGDEDVTDMFVPCHFVHELQHFLDDSGIDVEWESLTPRRTDDNGPQRPPHSKSTPDRR